MKRAVQIKFLDLLNPVKTPVIQMDIRMIPMEDGKFLVNANYLWADTAYFRFKGEFE